MLGFILFPDLYFEHLYNNIQEHWYLFKCRVMIEMCQTSLERLMCLAAHTSRSSHLIEYQPITSLKPPGLIFLFFFYLQMFLFTVLEELPWMWPATFAS